MLLTERNEDAIPLAEDFTGDCRGGLDHSADGGGGVCETENFVVDGVQVRALL